MNFNSAELNEQERLEIGCRSIAQSDPMHQTANEALQVRILTFCQFMSCAKYILKVAELQDLKKVKLYLVYH